MCKVSWKFFLVCYNVDDEPGKTSDSRTDCWVKNFLISFAPTFFLVHFPSFFPFRSNKCGNESEKGKEKQPRRTKWGIIWRSSWSITAKIRDLMRVFSSIFPGLRQNYTYRYGNFKNASLAKFYTRWRCSLWEKKVELPLQNQMSRILTHFGRGKSGKMTQLLDGVVTRS